MSDATCFHNLNEGGILRELAAGVTARVFPGVNAMLSVVTLEPHSVSPVHAHANEQWGVCLEGEWIRIQDGVEHHVKKGDFGDAPNSARRSHADTRCTCWTFAPPREEYRQAGASWARPRSRADAVAARGVRAARRGGRRRPANDTGGRLSAGRMILAGPTRYAKDWSLEPPRRAAHTPPRLPAVSCPDRGAAPALSCPAFLYSVIQSPA